MEMTPRMKQLLLVLLKEQKPISVKYLAEQTGISKRTVQRELEYIEASLKGYRLRFLSKTGVGVWLEGNEDEKHRLYTDISSRDMYDVGNREERRKRLILEILKEKGLRKLFYYSSQFSVSEATISTDLEAVEKWLNKYGLHVNRKPGSGIAIDGSEECYRKAIRAFIHENIDTEVLRQSFEQEHDQTYYESVKKSNIGKVLNDDIMKRVMDCIAGIDHAKMLTLTENSYAGLVIHISIAINRILKNEVIESNQSWQDFLPEDEDYQLAEVIVAELEEEFRIEIPKVEVSYICLHIKGAKHEKVSWNGEAGLEMESREIQQLVNAMIDAYDPQQAYLLKQDEEFIQGLLAHLQPTLVRLTYGMQIQNPVLEDIKNNYPAIYARCGKVAGVLEKRVGKCVPEEEIGFLTVHFGAAMVRLEGKREQIRKVHVGVVCSSGIGISRLMSSKLKKVFKDRMELTTYGKNDITPYIAGKTDFFVSSIPMDRQQVPVIYVNPLLNEENMEEIRRMTYQYERIPRKQKESDEFSVQLEQISTQIFAEFGFALLHTRTKGVIRPGFSICMTKDLGAFLDPYFKGITTVYIMLAPIDDHLQVNNDILGHISGMLIEEYEFTDTVARGDKEEIRDVLSRYLKKYFNQCLTDIS